MVKKKELPIAPYYTMGTKRPVREFDNEKYVGYRYLKYKSAAKGIVKGLKEEGYEARITDPEYTTPQLDPIYVVWMKQTDYNKKSKKIKAELKAEIRRYKIT